MESQSNLIRHSIRLQLVSTDERTSQSLFSYRSDKRLLPIEYRIEIQFRFETHFVSIDKTISKFSDFNY